jgi:sugar O-acyltransferase (sialic acid O-acetyltransferase NeuD family)
VALLVVGAGDHARVVLEGFAALGVDVVGCIDVGSGQRPDRRVGLVTVVGTLDDTRWLGAHDVDAFVVALGDNRQRAAAFERCIQLGLRPERMIHPTAIVLRGAEIGPGSQVCAGAVIGVDARVGANAIINTLASVDHDDEIADHVSVAPGAHLAGRVSVGRGARVGIGATIREGIRIGDGATVAAGAVVVRDVPANMRVAGVPASPMNDSHQEAE